MGGIPETEAASCFFFSPTLAFLLFLHQPPSGQNTQDLALKHSKMWKSHSINIPKYLAEDVEICKMLELVKVEQERVEKLKKEVKTTMLRRGRFNWSTIVPMRGG